MSSKAKGNHKLTTKSRRLVSAIAAELAQQVIIDGLRQYTIDGIVEAKWKLAGIGNLLLRLGDTDGAKARVAEAGQMSGLLNSQNSRGEVWQNLKEGLEGTETEDPPKD